MINIGLRGGPKWLLISTVLSGATLFRHTRRISHALRLGFIILSSFLTLYSGYRPRNGNRIMHSAHVYYGFCNTLGW